MSGLHMQCTFEVNGEDHVGGTLSFLYAREDIFHSEGVELVFHVDKLPRGSIELKISPDERVNIANFFTQEDMYFWKIVILEPEPPYSNVMCIVSFSKDDSGVAIHLSLDFESEKMHIETPIDEETLNDMEMVWGAGSK